MTTRRMPARPAVNLTRSSMIAVVALAPVGCSVDAPPEPTAGTFEWTEYANEAAGFVMDVPDAYQPDEEPSGRSVLFRTDEGVPVKVYWITAEEGEGRGLWFGETPTGPARLGGLGASLYEYRHCDGPFCSRIVSYVVPHRGRHLALEFRSDGALNATNLRILESFRLASSEAGLLPRP